MQSIEMHSPMASINNKYNMYPQNQMTDSYSNMNQYTLSMSTNINVGIIKDKNQKQKQSRRGPSNVTIKQSIASRGNFRKTKRSRKPPGAANYPARALQDSQAFSRIARGPVGDSASRPGGLFSPDEPEPYERKPIDSQIGSAWKRDASVGRAGMRNQANLASLVVSSGKGDQAISPNPRRPMLADSIMFKSTISPNSNGTFNQQSITGALGNRPGVSSPGKDSRNIKLDPIDMCKLHLSLPHSCN